MTVTPGQATVAVVGGGWAGCAAALTLAEAGVAVTLYEAARTLGGRARAVELDGQAVDNGQHILLGAYTQTLELIGHVQSDAAASALWRLPLSLRQPPSFSLACPPLPAPLHLLAGLIAARGPDWREKLAAARWTAALLRGDVADDCTVSELTAGQPPRLNRWLWHPLCVSALNTPPETASGRVFREVVRAAFGSRRQHSDLILPRRDLTALFPAPAAARVAALGGSVRLGCRVGSIAATTTGITLQTALGSAAHSHVVVAVAPQHAAGLLAGIGELAAVAARLATYRYLPIATAYVRYAPEFGLRHPVLALAGGPAQFVFDRGQSHGQAGLLAFVASAATALPADWPAQADAQLRRVVDPGAVRWQRQIVEKQATYACVPGLPRPPVRTGHPRVFLAGDYTAGPYPATLESATSSGVQSARSLLAQL